MNFIIGLSIVCGLVIMVFGLHLARRIFKWVLALLFASISVFVWYLFFKTPDGLNLWFSVIPWVFVVLAYLTIRSL